MSDIAHNPRAVMGGNLPGDAPDFAKMEVERLTSEYAELLRVVDGLCEEEAAITSIDDNDDKGKVTSLMKRLRDAAKRATGLHEIEKMPHFRRGQGCDQFFFGQIDKLSKRDKKAKNGAFNRLEDMLTAYDTKLLREEQERRRLADEEARRERDRQQAEADRLARETEEKRLAAERARKLETIAAKTDAADAAAVAASAAAAAAEIASAAAQERRIETFAKPADLMRQRGADGTLSTMGTEPFAFVTHPDMLDKEKLWAFIPLAAKEQALRAWAKNTGYTQTMPGADIGKRPKSKVV